jgi:dipeptidyl aminopeptidase/acylaminoacyl peptidase
MREKDMLRLEPDTAQCLLRLLLSLWMLSLAVVSCDSTKPKGDIKGPVDVAPAFYSEPIWSPDGTRLAFNYRPLDSVYVGPGGVHHYAYVDSLKGFWMMNADGSDRHRVMSEHVDFPDWSPDGAWIAYGRGGDIRKVQTTPAGLDTTTREQLTFQGRFAGPSWSPSNRKIAFCSFTAGSVALYWVGAGGGAASPIPSDTWREPDWSPDGGRLVFIGQVEGAYGIGECDTLGSSENLISNVASPSWPKWSPDGSMIAFLAPDPVTHMMHLWVMNSDGSNVRKATTERAGLGFAWAPDNRRIAYVRHELKDHSSKNGTIWIADIVDGSNVQVGSRELPAP